MEGAFPNRAEAGRLLGLKLSKYVGRDDVIVLGLPRGGVPVAYEVAQELRVPLDVFIVRKLGVRSEEHTSELQSHLNLVCRLLLEKKKYYLDKLMPRHI